MADARSKNGGARKGAGRKPGKKNVVASEKSQKIVADFVESGDLTPLEVMLMVMTMNVKAQNWPDAMHAANSAAPYVHPRLAATTISGDKDAPVHVTFIDNIK